jgi:hypothetical protein
VMSRHPARYAVWWWLGPGALVALAGFCAGMATCALLVRAIPS